MRQLLFILSFASLTIIANAQHYHPLPDTNIGWTQYIEKDYVFLSIGTCNPMYHLNFAPEIGDFKMFNNGYSVGFGIAGIDPDFNKKNKQNNFYFNMSMLLNFIPLDKMSFIHALNNKYPGYSWNINNGNSSFFNDNSPYFNSFSFNIGLGKSIPLKKWNFDFYFDWAIVSGFDTREIDLSGKSISDTAKIKIDEINKSSCFELEGKGGIISLHSDIRYLMKYISFSLNLRFSYLWGKSDGDQSEYTFNNNTVVHVNNHNINSTFYTITLSVLHQIPWRKTNREKRLK